jgi:hypothetical protein
MENGLNDKSRITQGAFWILLIIFISKSFSYAREGFHYVKSAQDKSFSFLCRDSLDSPTCRAAIHSEDPPPKG